MIGGLVAYLAMPFMTTVAAASLPMYASGGSGSAT